MESFNEVTCASIDAEKQQPTEKLYKDILSDIRYNVDNNATTKFGHSSLCSYVQNAFKISNTRHEQLFAAAMDPSSKYLKLQVIKAKELTPKDSTCNSFTVMFIQSTSEQKFHTAVKNNTINPVWEEHLEIPLKHFMKDDECLVVEVWNSKRSKTINKKTAKILGRTDDGLVGRCRIPLESISTSNQCKSFTLYRNEKSKSRGSIELQLMIENNEKNHYIKIQEHKRLLEMLLQYELTLTKMAEYGWTGDFSELGETIIELHIAQNQMTLNECYLARWSAFTKVHNDHACSFRMFRILLDNLLCYVKSMEISVEEMLMFWDGVKKLIPSCFSIIRNSKRQNVEHFAELLNESLSILSIISIESPPNDFDLFPKEIYGWFIKTNENHNEPNIKVATQQAIRLRAQDFLLQIHEFHKIHHHQFHMDNLKNIIKVISIIDTDLQYGHQHYRKLFKEKLQCDYTSICFNYYENEMLDCFPLAIEKASKIIIYSQTNINSADELSGSNESDVATMLFSIYTMLKRFCELGNDLYAEGSNCRISSYHEWFADGVANWLEVCYRKALEHIEKAIELDKLITIDETVNHTSSVVDAVSIVHPIKSFWLQLNWPDIESGFTFIAKIVDDICRCGVHYVTKLSIHVNTETNRYTNDDNSKLHVIRLWCIAINNIDYMRVKLPTFLEQLNLNDIIDKLMEYKSRSDSQRCEETLKTFIDNALDTIENQMFDIIQSLTNHICLTIRTSLLHAIDYLQSNSRNINELRSYIDNLTQIIHTKLNESNCKRIVTTILDETANHFHELIEFDSDKRFSPQLYKNLYECLQIINSNLICENKCNHFIEIENFLQLHSCESSQLIHLYYMKRYEEQHNLHDAPYGQLTISAHFTEYNYLELKIINARNLISCTANDHCNPYVQVRLIPNAAIKYDSIVKYKTNVHNKTTFPLFDEQFLIPLTKQHKAHGNSLIKFCVIHHDLFGVLNRHLGECFITFDDISNSVQNQNEQIHLNLNHSSMQECDYITALKLRKTDKLANHFIKKFERKYTQSVSRFSLIKPKFRLGSAS